MIPVPANRLIWTLLGVAAIAAVAGPIAGMAWVWVAALVLSLILALVDLGLSLKSSRMPQVRMADSARFSKDREGPISLTFAHEGGVPTTPIRFALGLPPVFASKFPELAVSLPADAKLARIDWLCTPKRRGRFRGVLACCEIGSVLGFWRLRSRRELGGELRVYPNLFAERRQLAAIFLSRGQFGAKVQRTVGRGREVEKLRDYLPGDGYDEIHWKATAKRGHPVTKVFQAERTQEIYVVIDASRLSARPVVHEGIEQTALERYLTAALVLLLAAESQGDRFGLLIFDDRVRTFLRAGSGDGHYAACREAVHAIQPSETTPDMAEIVRALRTRLTRRSLLFFLTDLTDPVLAEDFVRHAKMLARQHLVLVNQLRPPGVAPLFTGAEVSDVSEIRSRLAGHMRWQELAALGKKLKPEGVSTVLLEDDTMAAQLVSQYLKVKQRQLL